jgi:hypothetical protein
MTERYQAEWHYTPNGDRNRMKTAKQLVVDYINDDLFEELELADEATLDEVYIVWFCKTLQNWKALISTDLTDEGIYFEVTFDGDKDRAYLDHYWKSVNRIINLVDAPKEAAS